ncbi:PTS sugar transporter subunit IIA [Anaerococcus sp. Marseille-P9784]|uniref:PTS sugar transporter subunit IIA n=1 Tax=Anaerococcus sp. Marseille-P9784 TaxID=2614127 RepID=UPI00124A21C2|nr:PTS fructose transporter subunit IIBC [Anaerococcus sp. Marseille-P9784]
MKGIILTSHGTYASGLYQTVKMIAGDFPNIKIVEFHEGDNLENFDQKLIEAYNDLTYKDIVVITDLAGGTPFNRSVMSLADKGNVAFLSGANFAMVYQALSSEIEDLSEFVADVLEKGKSSITKFDMEEDDEESLEDGI